MTYFLVGLIYIFASDWIVENGAAQVWLPGIQTTKGVGFVVVSALLIHFLIAREMRRQQALEQQLMRAQRMEAVGQLTNGVAHDFNNFLTVILGNLELIQQDAGEDQTLRKRADHALVATERGADLTRRLLSFSRKQSLEPRPVDVNECVAQMSMLLESVLGEGIKVRTDLTADLPPIIADPGQLETAMLNLALNSRDAMPDGGVISLTTGVVELDSDYTSGKWHVAKGNYVLIAVTDEGFGMSPFVQDQLLELFFTTKPDGKGSGLGFSMAHAFVKQSGGYVVVYSEVGHGTTVKFYFPSATPPEMALSNPSPTLLNAKGGETILLVDNDLAVREILNDFLTRLGYRVLLASCASEADAILEKTAKIDLLMSDIVLGDHRTGVELANAVRRQHPSIRVLLISGFAYPSGSGKLSEQSPFSWLAKPFSQHAVARRLRELLDH